MVPGIVARDESCRSIPCTSRRVILGANARGQTDAVIDPHATIGGNFINDVIKLFASRVLGVPIAEHLADYCRDWFFVARCGKEEIRMTVFAKDLRTIRFEILIFTVATFGKMGRTVIVILVI